ncbi:hypothetical protein [Streptomyces sp. NPDC060322]|uniref:hypothetical protein n=1 Tax=Streptomyces sp. NPDC060322 TaxID=3347097 RepID=UPI003650F059
MTTPFVLSDDTRLLLSQLAETLEARRPGAEMREDIRLARALVLAEELYGETDKAFTAEQDLLAAAPPVGHQTRGEYAALLRLIARGVTQ